MSATRNVTPKSTEADWLARVHGQHCPLDAPRPSSNEFWDHVATMTVSSLYLAKNQTYRGQCQLIFDPRHVARVDELTVDEWTRLAGDLYRAEQTIVRVLRRHHTIHHDISRMTTENFNITFPIADRIFGTNAND
jgi:hypothetical protein